MHKLLDDLNPQQQEAANHIEGPLLVLAGAGSGKTRIVTYRIANLLNVGVPSGEILALTFTNKAAEEMRYRVRKLTNQYVLCSTFHSLSARILRESIHYLGYKNSFTIYDDDDAKSLVKACLKILGHKDDKASVKSMCTGISNAKNALLDPHEVDDAALRELFTLYQSKLSEYNALDFDDLLFLTVKLFRQHPKVLALYQEPLYQERWQFVLFDEYQDTNEAQYILTKLLTEKHRNLFVVGDPDQSIYSWRGANIENILDFNKDFPGAKVVKLEQNYRSTEHILKAANHLISYNESRYEKNLWSSLGNGNKVELRFFSSEREEAMHVVNTLFTHHKEENIPLNSMAIFYRTNSQSRIFEDALLQQQIPYVIIGGLSFYQRREIKDVLALLRVAVSGSDFLSFSRTINLPRRGFGKAAIKKLHDAAEQTQLPILTLCENALQDRSLIKLSAKQQEGLRDYVSTVVATRTMRSQNLSLRDIIRETIERSRYLDYLKEDQETCQDRVSNIEELVSKAAEWELERENPSLDLFLEELTLRANVEEGRVSLDTVKLMTLHNSKGLEFPVVCIVGLEEDLLPHMNSKETPEEIEEERRLLYVGMTRAKKSLHISCSKYRLIWGTPRNMEVSRFVAELPKEHVDMEDEEDLPEGFPPGTHVIHKDFGRGVVESSYETSLGLTYEVYFQSCHESKCLVAKYARLKRA